MSGLGARVFAAYSRNSGNDPAEHFDRNAAEQWMAQALEECGVAALAKAARQARKLAHSINQDDENAINESCEIMDALDPALALIGAKP